MQVHVRVWRTCMGTCGCVCVCVLCGLCPVDPTLPSGAPVPECKGSVDLTVRAGGLDVKALRGEADIPCAFSFSDLF